MARNKKIKDAVDYALVLVDAFINEKPIVLPPAAKRKICDKQLSHRSGSVKLGSFFLACYALQDLEWGVDQVPVGIRGKYGDKLLSEQLTQRHVTLHSAITAFGENLGWKGNVAGVKLSTDPRFADFIMMLKASNNADRKLMAEYFACKFAESRREIKPLPPVGDDVLTFARAKALFTSVLHLPTEGHVQQFLVAAMLSVHRRKYGVEIRTHHPHAADKYDDTAGDIEEFHEGKLARAYEVTVRPDWKNRLMDFRAKMDGFGLTKYIIIASGISDDDELMIPAKMIAFLSPMQRDVAVVDIEELVVIMTAELSASELRQVVNLTYDFLCRKELCGRSDFQEAYRGVVDSWLDEAFTA